MTTMSPWQHHRSSPKIIGVYQRKIFGVSEYFSYWNGDYWCAYAHDVSQAKRYKTMRSYVQYAKWRGVIDEE